MSWKPALFALLALVLLMPVATVLAEGGIGKKIGNRYEKIDSFRTEFVQELIEAETGETQTREGRIVYQRPGRIYWKTEEPEERLLIVNESHVWEVIFSEKVAYKYSREQVLGSSSVLDFISGEVNLSKDFLIKEKGSESKNQTRLELTPKEPKASLMHAEIDVNKQDLLLRRIQLRRFSGDLNILHFKNIQLGFEPQSDLFSFQPPEDFRVADNTEKDSVPGGQFGGS